MIPLGLSASQLRIYHDTLRSSHLMRTRIMSAKLNGDTLNDLSVRLWDGQVDVDKTAEQTRVASLTLLDPNHLVNLDSDDPDDGALYLDRMIRIWYGVLCPFGWVEAPIFTGPITSMTRNDAFIDLEAGGKELLALRSGDAGRWGNWAAPAACATIGW